MNYPLTNPQNSIWLTEKFYTGTSVNNICGYVYISDAVNFTALKSAINELARTNDSMRLKFKEENNSCVQYLNDYKEFDIDIIELSSEKEIEKKALEMASVPFEMKDNFLFKFILFRLPDDRGGFIVNIHHIISDSWTLGLVAKEVTDIYSKLISSTYEKASFPSYLKYIEQEKEYINSDKYIKDQAYWNEVFQTVPEVASIPSMKDVPSQNVSCAGSREKFIIPKEQINSIKDFCTKNKISVYNFFMSAYSLYLGRVSNLDDFVVGTPILNRTNFEQKHTMGMFISTAPLRINLDHSLSFTEFSKKVATDTISILRHQKYPYQAILEDLRKKEANLPNLYNVVLSYQITKTIEENSNIKYSTDWVFNGCCADELQIHLFDLHDEDSITVAYDYKADKYDSQDINDLHNRILTVINQVIQNNDILLKDIEIVTPEEKHKILYEFNNTKVDYPRDKTIVDLFEEQVEKTPDNIAVVFEDQQLTYRELNEKANQLARYLIKNDIVHNDKICIFFDNSIESVISILSVLKCGACYIPIDVNYPEERILYIFNNSNAKKILSNPKNAPKLNRINDYLLNIDLDKLTDSDKVNINNSQSNDSAYIIYTSGSTGQPKGVEILNKNLVHYIWWAKKQYVGEEITNFPLYSSISFDLTVTSIFTPLISGNSIYIYVNDNAQLLLKQIILDKKVQIIKLTPAHLVLLSDCIIENSSVKKLIVGGDILTPEICRNISEGFNNNIKIFNEYGPTETTVGCMIYEYNKTDHYSSVPIGIPIDNINIYILDKNLKVLPYGCSGEIYISGEGVGKGYFNNEKITQERFLINPFNKNFKLYKTGDVAKMYSNGLIEYIGRSDFQFKINGYRIELGEIQSKLHSYPNIKDCYVTVLEIDKIKNICAYYVASDYIDTSSLKHFLTSYLPVYMIPKHYIALDEIPLTVNGKPNKSLLPFPRVDTSKRFVSPKTKLQTLIHGIMCKLLGLESLSITADFFDFFIDSLTIIKAQAMLYSKGYTVDTQAFYEHSTIQDLEKYILSISNIKDNSISSSNANSNLLKVTDIQHEISQNISSPQNILLFGSTGFLGIHLLYELLINTKAKIYCIIREKENVHSVQRLFESFNFYFTDLNIEDYSNRINVITGNLLENNFGLSNCEYNTLGNKIDCVIDSAAIVKHYGDYKLFYDLNVLGTKKVIKFCTSYKIPLHYISTLSVSGYGLVQSPQVSFSEKDLFVGQDYISNVYVRSKFEAEQLILNSCKEEKLIASIYRIGNITNRFSDGCFQKNFYDNAFINRLSAFINLRIHPKRT